MSTPSEALNSARLKINSLYLYIVCTGMLSYISQTFRISFLKQDFLVNWGYLCPGKRGGGR